MIVLKNLPVNENLHYSLKNEAKKRDMKLRGLTERIITKWLNDQKKFNNEITLNNA